MARILLFHWHAEEAEARATRLRRAGHHIGIHARQQDVAGFRAIRERVPDVFVIDLARLPSHGRAAATWLRQQKATRGVPIVFIEGDPAKTARIRAVLPDAVYTTWPRIRGAVRQAMQNAPTAPVVPGTMDAYKGAPLPKKLGIKPGTGVVLLGAPRDFEATLAPLPADVTIRRQARGRADVVLLFVRSHKDLARRFRAARRTVTERGRLWITWPKRSSSVSSDLSQQSVRAFGLDAGLVDFKICAVDATWSALCFTRHR